MQVWVILYNPSLFTDELYQKALHLVDADSQTRITRFYHRQDACRCLIGRILPRMLLSEHGIRPQDMAFGRTASNKPYITTSFPEKQLAFNVSHDHGLITMVSAPGQHHAPHFSLGIDIMMVTLPSHDSFISFVRLMKDQLTAREVRSVLSVPEDEGLRRFYWLWTLKEAYTKALGIGLGFDFKRVEYDIEADIVRIDNNIPRGWRFSKFVLNHDGNRYQGVVAEYEGEQAATYVIHEPPSNPEWLHLHDAVEFVQRAVDVLAVTQT